MYVTTGIEIAFGQSNIENFKFAIACMNETLSIFLRIGSSHLFRPSCVLDV